MLVTASASRPSLGAFDHADLRNESASTRVEGAYPARHCDHRTRMNMRASVAIDREQGFGPPAMSRARAGAVPAERAAPRKPANAVVAWTATTACHHRGTTGRPRILVTVVRQVAAPKLAIHSLRAHSESCEARSVSTRGRWSQRSSFTRRSARGAGRNPREARVARDTQLLSTCARSPADVAKSRRLLGRDERRSC